ncbi:Do family serine endopeptidase [Halocola ammonii]
MKRFLSAFLIATLGGFVALGTYKLYLEPETTTLQQSPFTSQQVKYVNMPNVTPPEGSSDDFVMAAERSVNAVVHVKTEQEVQNVYNPWAEFFGQSRGSSEPHVQRGSGSGVIISEDGYITTNNHVIDGADRIKVILNNNRSYDATLVGHDPATDLAVLKIDEANLPTIAFGTSDNVKVGEWVLAVGNPFELTSTVTAGIVSAKARNINLLRYDQNEEVFPIESFIQTDAAVNPGNSGGALVNTRGELIGINTAIASRTGSYSGYSFAIPSSIVKKVANDIIEYGNVQRGYIGVKISEVNEEVAEESGLNAIRGVYVNGLMADGAAALAGIEEGDIILSVNERNVNSVPSLQEQVSKYRPGDKVNVTVWRDGKTKDLDLTLRNSSGTTAIVEKAEAYEIEKLGASFSEVSADLKGKLNISGGAKIESLGEGKFKNIGIKEGFIITSIDRNKIESPEDLEKVLSSKSGGVLIEGVYPNGTKAYYGFGL